MFVVTLNRARLRQIGVGVMCCAVVVCSALLGRYISTRTVEAAAGTGGQNAKIETAQDIQTWFTGYGIEVDGASITADKVKIPRKWDDSFAAFNTVVGQSGLDLERYKGKTVEKWQALIPAASNGEESCYGVLLVYKKKPVGAYLLAKPSGLVTGLGDAQAAMAEADEAEAAAAAPSEETAASPEDPVQETSGEPGIYAEESTAPYTDLPIDAEGYPVE